MTTPVRFWVDPICPWCWVTARWVRTIADRRDLDISWEPISLFVKNDPAPDGPSHQPLAWSLGLLRVLESVRASGDPTAVGELYVEYGRRIHHDKERLWDPAEALRAAGVDESHAAAASDNTWDGEVRRRMDEGLALVGTDVGTPIISVRGVDDREVALFGPVITKVPAPDDALALWDAVAWLATLDEFYELKRTRTVGADVGERP
jgi:hypothetical protein